MADARDVETEPVDLGDRVGVFSDVHGERRTLQRALDLCRQSGVETIALLGDLFDRVEEADLCIELLLDWNVVGVYGNHEREIVLAAAAGEVNVRPRTIELLSSLQERVMLDDDVCLIHEEERWGFHDPVAAMFERVPGTNGHRPAAWITFAGHTHVRSARNESGPLDLGRGRIALTSLRRYLINPGALAIGQFAIWDRAEREVHFHQLEDR